MPELCCCVPGPLAGPRQLRIDERQSYDRDYHYRGTSVADVAHLSTSNSSEDRIHLMISWRVIDICC